jgi:threonine-phosphate decarboxylase
METAMTTSLASHFICRPAHGGNLEEIAAAYGVAPNEFIDFSSNLNPAGPPASVVSRISQLVSNANILTRYPEPDCSSLARAIAANLHLDPQCVVVANGSAALLDIALRALRPKRCLLPIPAFSEYDRALSAADIDCDCFRLRPDEDFRLDVEAFVRASDEGGCDFWILANPHNPSGSALGVEESLRLLEAARDRQVTVLLDEAFVDYCPEISVSRVAANLRNLVVLRSFTKFYALAGLRVGFAVANSDCAERLRLQVPSWPVSSLAITAAIEAISDAEYSRETLCSCMREREWLSHQLEAQGLRAFPSAANFLLLRLPPAAPSATVLRESLIVQHKIVVRDCSSYQGLEGGKYFRIAVLDRGANEKFIKALKEVLTL